MTENEAKTMQSNYEKKFAKYMDYPQPTIKDIRLEVDIFPEERTARIKGEYLLYNNKNKAIKEFCLNLNDWNLSNIEPMKFDKDVNKKLHADEFGFRVFELKEAMKPGDTILMTFKYDIIANGFTENNPKNEIVENGTCLKLSSFSSSYFPLIGYNVNNEILNDKDRLEYRLEKEPDAPTCKTADNTRAICDISRPDYEAIISTSSDQIAITGGKLIKQWNDGSRRYFHYKTDTIIENETPIISGRYAVERENYNGVKLEVYYHPKHAFNISSIMDGLRDSYDYGEKYFLGYPYSDLRIVEMPKYMMEAGARHFPTTFIWNESEGFITKYEEDDDIDIVYGIAAHENTHHWWAGIVTPAYAEGAFVLTETMCQYVMGILTEKKFGKDIGRAYHQREMRSYLRRRKRDAEGEKSLVESSIRQSYLGYKKSSAVMYALQDYISEDSVGIALGRIVDKFGFRLDTFALATDVVSEFYKVCPDSLKYLIDDLFLKITLYENKINNASYKELENGQYLIELNVEAAKFYADSIGKQSQAAMNDYIYIGLMDEDGKEFYYKKHRFSKTDNLVKIITDRIPSTAGIDPFLVLIDRNMDDNVCEVKKKDI